MPILNFYKFSFVRKRQCEVDTVADKTEYVCVNQVKVAGQTQPVMGGGRQLKGGNFGRDPGSV